MSDDETPQIVTLSERMRQTDIECRAARIRNALNAGVCRNPANCEVCFADCPRSRRQREEAGP